MTETTLAAQASDTAAERPHRALLPVVLTAAFMTTLDFFIVNVAIPALQRELHAGAAAIQWVVAGFGLAVAAGLITAGRLGDTTAGGGCSPSASSCSPSRRRPAAWRRPPGLLIAAPGAAGPVRRRC